MQFTTHHLSRGLKFPEDKETKEVQFPKSLEHNCFRILKTIKKTEHHKNKAYDMPIFLFQIRQLISNQLHCFFFFFFCNILAVAPLLFCLLPFFPLQPAASQMLCPQCGQRSCSHRTSQCFQCARSCAAILLHPSQHGHTALCGTAGTLTAAGTRSAVFLCHYS